MKRLSESDHHHYGQLTSRIIRRNYPGLDKQTREAWIDELIEKLHATATEFVATKRNT